MTKHYGNRKYNLIIIIIFLLNCCRTNLCLYFSDQVQASEPILAPFVARRLKMQESHHDLFW